MGEPLTALTTTIPGKTQVETGNMVNTIQKTLGDSQAAIMATMVAGHFIQSSAKDFADNRIAAGMQSSDVATVSAANQGAIANIITQGGTSLFDVGLSGCKEIGNALKNSGVTGSICAGIHGDPTSKVEHMNIRGGAMVSLRW